MLYKHRLTDILLNIVDSDRNIPDHTTHGIQLRLQNHGYETSISRGVPVYFHVLPTF